MMPTLLAMALMTPGIVLVAVLVMDEVRAARAARLNMGDV